MKHHSKEIRFFEHTHRGGTFLFSEIEKPGMFRVECSVFEGGPSLHGIMKFRDDWWELARFKGQKLGGCAWRIDLNYARFLLSLMCPTIIKKTLAIYPELKTQIKNHQGAS
jgi:hypothetical protein